MIVIMDYLNAIARVVIIRPNTELWLARTQEYIVFVSHTDEITSLLENNALDTDKVKVLEWGNDLTNEDIEELETLGISTESVIKVLLIAIKT